MSSLKEEKRLRKVRRPCSLAFDAYPLRLFWEIADEDLLVLSFFAGHPAFLYGILPRRPFWNRDHRLANPRLFARVSTRSWSLAMVVTFLSLKGAQASWENWRRGRRLLVFGYVSTQGFPRFPKSCLPSYSLKAFLISLPAVYLEAFSFRTERKPTATFNVEWSDHKKIGVTSNPSVSFLSNFLSYVLKPTQKIQAYQPKAKGLIDEQGKEEEST